MLDSIRQKQKMGSALSDVCKSEVQGFASDLEAARASRKGGKHQGWENGSVGKVFAW